MLRVNYSLYMAGFSRTNKQATFQHVALDEKSPLSIYSHAALHSVARAMFLSLTHRQAACLLNYPRSPNGVLIFKGNGCMA